jgi:hypothetical protein
LPGVVSAPMANHSTEVGGKMEFTSTSNPQSVCGIAMPFMCKCLQVGAHPKSGLSDYDLVYPDEGLTASGPRSLLAAEATLLAWGATLHLMTMNEHCACGTEMMDILLTFPAGVRKTTDSDDRISQCRPSSL